MTVGAGAFLGGVKGRLLPASIPLRYFGAAIAFHVLAWFALLADAAAATRFAGGLGWPLAALHLVTLGVLAMTAMGASLQLLPVATRQPIAMEYGATIIWWVYTLAVAALALGMGLPSPRLLAGGAFAVVAALAAFAVLLARNLVGARGMPGVVAHGWVAAISLLIVLVTAVSLAGMYVGLPGLTRVSALALHVPFAAYGFMGMLALGLSYILVPMFALSPAPDERRVLASCAFAVLGLALAAAAVLDVAPRPMRIAAIVAGLVAVALHLRLMQVSLRDGMRRELGLSFRLVRLSWGLLAVGLLVALLLVGDAPPDGTAALFGVALIAGWLLSFLLGILQRVVPFLASMHAAPVGGAPPTPSRLTSTRPLAIHYGCHLAALALVALGIVADNSWLVGAAAVLGALGAAAFGVFFVIVLRRMGRPRTLVRPAPAA